MERALQKPEPPRRSRPALACTECRRRKVKCDRKDPCLHCGLTKSHCVYRVTRGREIASCNPSPNPSAQTVPPVPSTQYPARETLTEETIQVIEAPGSTATTSTIEHEATHLPNHTQGLEDKDPKGTSKAKKPDESSPGAPPGSSTASRYILDCQSGLDDAQTIMNKTRLLGRSHWMPVSQAFTTIFACFREATLRSNEDHCENSQTKSLIVQMGHLIRRYKDLARYIKASRPTRCLSPPEFSLVPPPRAVTDTMMDFYFRFFESTYRILHLPTFSIEYKRYWDQPEAASMGTRLKVLLVVAIGSSLYEHQDNDVDLRNMIHQWLYTAQLWLSGPLEKDRLDITGLQVHCLLILARQIFALGGDLVWASMGSLVNSAMQIGLHRDPKHLPTMTAVQAEVRRRLWATVLEMAMQSSLDSGMPPRISLDEFDTEAPSNINDDEIGNEPMTTIRPHPETTFTTTSAQLFLLSSLRSRHQILKVLNGLSSDISYEDILSLSSDVMESCRRACSILRGNLAVTAFHLNMLGFLVRRFLLVLHCPFLSRARTNPLFYYSRKVSVDTATVMVNPEPDDRYKRLMIIGGGMFKEGIRYAGIAIALELITQAEEQFQGLTIIRDSNYLSILNDTVRETLSLSADRIRHGETNVKFYVFLSMVMAQSETLGEEDMCKAKIVESGRDSLQLCVDLLEAQASSMPIAWLDAADMKSLDNGIDNYAMDFDLDVFQEAGFLST